MNPSEEDFKNIVLINDSTKCDLLSQVYNFEDFESFMEDKLKAWTDYPLTWIMNNMAALKGELPRQLIDYINQRTHTQPGLLPRKPNHAFSDPKSAKLASAAPPPANHFSNCGRQPSKLRSDVPNSPITPSPPTGHHSGQPTTSQRNPGLLPPPPPIQPSVDGAKPQFPLAYAPVPNVGSTNGHTGSTLPWPLFSKWQTNFANFGGTEKPYNGFPAVGPPTDPPDGGGIPPAGLPSDRPEGPPLGGPPTGASGPSGHPHPLGGGGGGGDGGHDPHDPPITTPSGQCDFKVKPDWKDYPLLRDDAKYRLWRDQFRTVAYAHGLQQCFDNTYVPRHRNEQLCYIRMNCWLYMVLMFAVQTYEGKAIIQNQRHEYDACMVLWLLDQHYSHSTAAIILLGDMLQFLTSNTLDNTSVPVHLGME